MTSQLLSCWNLKSYRERLGMNCMIFVYLRLREDLITNEQWYFVMMNIARGWIDVRDDRFSKFHNRKKLRSLELFGKWRHNLNLNNLNLNLVINWHAQRARRKMSLIPSVLPKVLLVMTCHWIVGILKKLKKWCYGTWGNNQYINLQAEIYFEATIFIRPFEKRDVLCRGNVRPSVCPSVCPSVRPSVRVFQTFLQHALRYQFETWYMHSVGGTTCRVWVASQLDQFDLVYSQK